MAMKLRNKGETMLNGEEQNAEKVGAGQKRYTLQDETEKTRLEKQARSLYGGTDYIFPFIKEGMTVLDVGCGVGTMCRRIATRLSNVKAEGLDISEKKIEEANRLAVEEGVRLRTKFKLGDVYALPYPDNSFDVTHARFVFMHLTDPARALSEIIRVTVPGGSIVIHEGFHDAIWLEPRRPHFETILEKWKQFMAENGQDHSIGIKLHSLLTIGGLNDICVNVLPHAFHGGNPAFNEYMSNWMQHLPSLKKSMGKGIKDSDIDGMTRELNNTNIEDYYLELTVIVSGKK